MKPLSIEEIKQLEEDDYLWIVDFENNNNEYYKIVCNGQIVLKLNIIGDRCSWDVYYKDYGTKWLAYKNKEQAECKGTLIEFPCELGATIYYIKKQCRDFFNDFKDNEDNWCEDYEPQGWYEEERCNLVNKYGCSLNLEIYCEECKNRLKIEETKFCLELREHIYGTDYYNKNFSLSNTYFLTKKQAEQKLKELRGEK